MKKIIIMALLPMVANCMDSKVALSTRQGLCNRQEYVASTQFYPFNVFIGPAQRSLIKDVLNHNEVMDLYYGKYQDVFMCIAACTSMVIIVSSMIFALDHYMGGKNSAAQFVSAAVLIPIAAVSAAQLMPMYRRNREHELSCLFLKEGHRLQLGQVAQAITDMLDNGFKNQIMCRHSCQACSTKRKECAKCADFYGKFRASDLSERVLCHDCWYNVCARCLICKSMRDSDRYKHLAHKLGLHDSPRPAEIDYLKSYLQIFIRQQNKKAETSV